MNLRKLDCPRCDGTKMRHTRSRDESVPHLPAVEAVVVSGYRCTNCDKDGKVYAAPYDEQGNVIPTEGECHFCEGSGVQPNRNLDGSPLPCERCQGKGQRVYGTM